MVFSNRLLMQPQGVELQLATRYGDVSFFFIDNAPHNPNKPNNPNFVGSGSECTCGGQYFFWSRCAEMALLMLNFWFL